MKAKFLEQQPPVRFTNLHGKTYVYICVNEEEELEKAEDGIVRKTYLYDYNEFFDKTENVEQDAILADPKAFLNHDPNRKVDLYKEYEMLKKENAELVQTIKELENSQAESNALMLEMLEFIYE